MTALRMCEQLNTAQYKNKPKANMLVQQYCAAAGAALTLLHDDTSREPSLLLLLLLAAAAAAAIAAASGLLVLTSLRCAGRPPCQHWKRTWLQRQ
jgi:Na+(H+)/acetate symporter ActP